MHAGGFLDRNVTTSPSRLAIVLALHGAAIAALMLAKSEYIPLPPLGSIELIPIEAHEPPPPNMPEPAKQQPPNDTVKSTPPLVTSTASQTDTITPYPPEKPTYVEPTLPPPAMPVLTEATMVRGAEVQPPYPTSLARQEIEGVVIVRVLIGTDGRVKDVQMVSATEPEFFEATARQARRYWKFKPATRDGVAIESWRQMTVRFKLEG